MVIKEAIVYGRNILSENGIDPREARLLLASALKIEPSALIKIDQCSQTEFESFQEMLNRRILGEPFAYIVGFQEFMKLKFLVNPSVLIPRADTEVLVQEAIQLGKKKILDLCTGSGCIAISLAKYLQNSMVDASDISQEALKIAKENAKQNEVVVNFIHSDLFEKIQETYDLIVSNPPYIKKEEIIGLQKEVQHEPIGALDGGNDGLYFYQKIAQEASKYLNTNGYLMFEIGFEQAKEVTSILEKNGFQDIKTIQDLENRDRVIIAKRG